MRTARPSDGLIVRIADEIADATKRFRQSFGQIVGPKIERDESLGVHPVHAGIAFMIRHRDWTAKERGFH